MYRVVSGLIANTLRLSKPIEVEIDPARFYVILLVENVPHFPPRWKLADPNGYYDKAAAEYAKSRREAHPKADWFSELTSDEQGWAEIAEQGGYE